MKDKNNIDNLLVFTLIGSSEDTCDVDVNVNELFVTCHNAIWRNRFA